MHGNYRALRRYAAAAYTNFYKGRIHSFLMPNNEADSETDSRAIENLRQITENIRRLGYPVSKSCQAFLTELSLNDAGYCLRKNGAGISVWVERYFIECNLGTYDFKSRTFTIYKPYTSCGTVRKMRKEVESIAERNQIEVEFIDLPGKEAAQHTSRIFHSYQNVLRRKKGE